MNGLVSGYGTDSDEEDAAATGVTQNEEKSGKSSDWMECMDNTTRYPYYWNRVTNEVRWDRPSEMPPSSTHSSNLVQSKNDTSGKTEKRKQLKSKATRGMGSMGIGSKSPPQVFIGPTLPQLTPEEIARQKVVKFEETMAKDIEKEIVKEEPLDWHAPGAAGGKPQRGLYSKPFAWKKTGSTCLQTYRNLEASLKKASLSISLIAGSYGDEDDEDEEDATTKVGSGEKHKKFQGVHVKVQKPASKQPKPLLKDIPGIFKNDNDGADNADDGAVGKAEDPPKKKRRWDMKDRTYVNSTAEIL